MQTELQGGDKHVSCHLHLGRSQSFSSISFWINSHLSSTVKQLQVSAETPSTTRAPLIWPGFPDTDWVNWFKLGFHTNVLSITAHLTAAPLPPGGSLRLSDSHFPALTRGLGVGAEVHGGARWFTAGWNSHWFRC